MIIDVIRLKISGKEQENFSFEYFPKSEVICIPDAKIDGSVLVSGTLLLQGDDVYIDGEVSCRIVGKCARCVKETAYDFKGELVVTYVTQDPNEELGEYVYRRGVVDLSSAVDEMLIISVPSVIYCKADCKGLCPKCGADLNETTCSCKF